MNPLVTLYGVGLAQAPLLIIGLAAMRVRNRSARWLLVALITVLSLMLGEELLEGLGYSPGVGLGLALEFALGPLTYFFVRSLYLRESIHVRTMAPHAAPLAAALLLVVWLNSAFPENGVSLSHAGMRPIVAATVVTKILVFFGSSAAALSVPLPAAVAGRRTSVLQRLRSLLVLIVAAYAVQAVSFFAFLLQIPSIPDSDIVSGLVLAAALYGLGYFCFLNRDIFDLRDAYEEAPIAPEEAAAISRDAREYLRRTEAFRDPELDLRALARALLLPPGRLSQALNAGSGGGFASLVNTCRIDAFQKAREDPVNGGKSTLELAFEVGFNSKATFYRVLRGPSRQPSNGKFHKNTFQKNQ